jgi:hypothetical protein
MWQTKQLILHGAVVLLIGFACGAPMGRSIVRGRPEAVVRAWRVAHSSLVAGGVMLLAVASVTAHLKLAGWALSLMTISFIASSYAFALALPLGAHYGFRGLEPQPPLLNKTVYLGNILGVAGFFIGGLALVWGAYAAIW